MFKNFFFVNWLLPFIFLLKCSWQRIYYFQVYNLVIQLFSSVQFSRSVVSDSLQPHGLQHARPPCPSPTPGVYSNSCPLSRCCNPTVSSSVVPFSLAFNISQHQGLFKWVNSSHQVVKASPFIYTLIDHHNKSSNHLSPLSIAILLTVFTVHYISVTFTL